MRPACALRASSALVVLVTMSAATPARGAGTDSNRAEAAERFDRGIRLVNAGDLSGGLAEFQRAYSLVPSSVALFNVGLVYAALNRPVLAARALSKALAQPDALTPQNIARAQNVLREQQDKIGQVDVSANSKEGIVEVDNVEVASLPLVEPLDIASGPHVIGVVSPGYAPARREVLVAAREHARVRLELVTIEGLLAHIAVHGRVPASDVFVDGERVGKTPLESTVTVAPGAHQVEVRRAGYVSAQRAITLQDGAHGDVTLDPTVDKEALWRDGGSLAITASENQSVLTVDGAEFGLVTESVQLPSGPHRIRVESGGFQPAERDVDVPVGATMAVTVVFEPTPETRARYVSGARSRRTWSWIAIAAGTAIAAGGVIVALVEQNQLPGAQKDLAAVNSDWLLGSGHVCDHMRNLTEVVATSCNNRLNDASARVDNLQAIRTVGWLAAGVGATTLVTGAVLLLTGDDPHRYDERPIESLFAKWRVVPSVGVGSLSLTATRRF